MMYILSYKTQKLIAKNYEIPDDVFYELHDFCDSSVDLKNRMKDIILEYLNKSSDLILHDGTVNFRYNELTKQLFKIKKDIQTLYDLVSLKPEDLEEIIVGNEYYFEFDNYFLDNFSAEVQSFYLYEDTYFKYSFTINIKIKKIKEDFKDEGSILIPEVNLTNITLV